MLVTPLRVSGAYLTHIIKLPQYSPEEAYELATCVIPSLTKQQLGAVLLGAVKFTGYSPTLSIERNE